MFFPSAFVDGIFLDKSRKLCYTMFVSATGVTQSTARERISCQMPNAWAGLRICARTFFYFFREDLIVMDAWRSFKTGTWCDTIHVSDFIRLNYTPYEGDGSFLCSATQRTKDLLAQVQELFRQEQENGGALDIDTARVSPILYSATGYIENATNQNAATADMLRFLYLWAPIILCAIAMLLLSFLKVEQANAVLLKKKHKTEEDLEPVYGSI
mgnify:CR=1 FL=1